MTDDFLMQDLWRFSVWGAMIVLGAIVSGVERRIWGHQWLWLLLLLVSAGGYYLTVISPFTFGTGGYYMQGIIICAGAALVLIGYVIGAIATTFFRPSRTGKP